MHKRLVSSRRAINTNQDTWSSTGLVARLGGENPMGSMLGYAFTAAPNSTPVVDRAAPNRSAENLAKRPRRGRQLDCSSTRGRLTSRESQI